MSIWEYSGTAFSVVFLPLCVEGTNRDITLVLTVESNLSNAFLYTNSTYAGMVSAKVTGTSTYYDLSTYSTTPSFFLGNLTALDEISIDFRINVDDLYGEQDIPIALGSGDNISPYHYPGTNFFWRDDSTDDPFFWYSTSEEVDAGWWIGTY